MYENDEFDNWCNTLMNQEIKDEDMVTWSKVLTYITLINYLKKNKNINPSTYIALISYLREILS